MSFTREEAMEHLANLVDLGYDPSMVALGERYAVTIRAGGRTTPLEWAFQESVDAPTEVEDRYSVEWGYLPDVRGGTFYARFNRSTDRYSISSQDLPEIYPDQVLALEGEFCSDFGLTYRGLAVSLDWENGDKNSPAFVRKLESDVFRTTCTRLCPMGCGQVLKDHQRWCPNCVADGDALYNIRGGF